MSQEPCWPEAERALREVRQIIAERAAHPKWNTTAGAVMRKNALAEAEAILRKCVIMTYFEAPE